jgi:hypothetical protein
MKIKLEHARALKYCTKGIKEFFKKYNLDFNDFLVNGIDEEILCKFNNKLADKVIQKAKQDSNDVDNNITIKE